MTDNLRDTIAAALMDSLCAEIDKLGQYWKRYTPLDDNGEPTSEWWLGIDGSVDVRAVADAVIAELGLREESSAAHRIARSNRVFIPTMSHRYVTEWIAGD